ncbi:MAG: hypothetical protein KY468_11830 [Armatimonadetes bacterium]|nr:hypothetical protein [Armatimonadota bacterium]
MEEPQEEQGTYLICMPARPGVIVVTGSQLRECAECRCPVWQAPSGQQIEREKGAVLICIECASKRLKAEGTEAEFQMPTPEQLREIRNELGMRRSRTFQTKSDRPV